MDTQTPEQTPTGLDRTTADPARTTEKLSDDEIWIRRIRLVYPDWRIRTPSIADVQEVVGGGRSRAVRLRKAACPEQSGPAQTPTGPPVRRWPLLLLLAPAFIAVWSGWVGLGELTGFGIVHPLPGIADGFTINTAITLPIGVEVYAAYAMHVWLVGNVTQRARRFAMFSSLAALGLGLAGQVTYHLLTATDDDLWLITTAVACLPVGILGAAAALAHMVREPLK